MSTAHHPIGPSKAGRVSLCPGSVHLEARVAESSLGESEEINRGTLIHEAIAFPETGLEKLDMEEKFLVQRCWDYMEDTFGVEWRKHTLFEQRIEMKDEFGEIATFGTVDIIYVDGSRIGIVDWKTHWQNLPEFSLRWQLRLYGAGVLQAFHTYDRVTLCAYLPRIHKEYSGELYRAQIKDVVNSYQGIWDMVNAEGIQLNPGEEQCNYCRAKETCPALNREATELATIPDPTSLVGDRLARALEMRPALRKLLDELGKHAQNTMKVDPCGIPGWQLTERRGRKYITNPFTAYELLCGEIPEAMDLCKFMVRGSFSVNKLRDYYAPIIGKARDVTEKEAREVFDSIIRPAVLQGKSSFAVERDNA